MQKRTKYSKGIFTARVLLLVLIAVCTLITLFGFFAGSYIGDETGDAKTIVYFFGSYGVIHLALWFLSRRKPFVALLFAILMNSILFISLCFSLLTIENLCHDMFVSLPPVILFVLIVFFIRGAVFSNKLKRMPLSDQ